MTVDVGRLAPADRVLWEAMGDAVPLVSPVPTPGARHELHRADPLAAALGSPLMPWQRWAIRVLSEKRADDARRYRYAEYTLTVPRQAGKTTLVRVLLLARGMAERRVAFYTAQTRRDATARWMDLATAVQDVPGWSKLWGKPRVANGSECLTTLATRSTFEPFAPTPTSLHGYTPHDVIIDECFAFDAPTGNDLVGAIVPAQQTIPSRQLGIVSTAGHRDSTFLRAKVDAGREAAADPGSRLGFLEWGLPLGADPYDRSAWSFHPALGRTLDLEDMEAICDQFADHPGEWLRAICNRWTDTRESVFDMAAWDALGERIERPKGKRLVVGFEVAGGRAAAVVAFLGGDGRPVVETLHAHDQPGRFPAELAAMVQTGAELWADDAGDTRPVVDAVRRAAGDDKVRTLTARDYAAACAEFSAALREGRLVHSVDDGDLRAAVEGAQVRRAGEATVFRHDVNRPELVAATVALRGLVSAPRAVPTPDFRFG